MAQAIPELQVWQMTEYIGQESPCSTSRQCSNATVGSLLPSVRDRVSGSWSHLLLFCILYHLFRTMYVTATETWDKSRYSCCGRSILHTQVRLKTTDIYRTVKNCHAVSQHLHVSAICRDAIYAPFIEFPATIILNCI